MKKMAILLHTCVCESSAGHSVIIGGLKLVLQWNLIITVILGPNVAGCYIEVAFLLSGIQNHHN